ncbi:unnamed protein product [Brachionus calyciflorus]|uniref:Uncharacterized protein n=1 Tax=Brachionus calyciflorus TaxID=104777 RepID=A0A814BWS0_9BILA|nr:unnamed protein product [Brachionus calyciflorus]
MESKNIAESFVRNVLADKESYLLNAKKLDHSNKCDLYQFEYKVEKSKAVLNMELLEKGLVEIPRWIVYVSLIIMTFLIAFFILSLLTLGNIIGKSDAMYQQSCSDRPCSKALNLKCINKTCQCESPKYYTKKCVDLSKYGEKCMFTSHCINGQSLSCMGSICSCALNKYWSSDVSLCVDRLTYGQSCSGDQCKINSNLICSSSGTCDCIDDTLYYWSDSSNSCISKKKYSQACTLDSQCLNSQLTICKNNEYCLCIDTEYFDGTNCVAKVGEGIGCSYDYMCLNPMYCDTQNRNCTCAPYYFYDTLTNNCKAQYSNGQGLCYSHHHCRQDYKLTCDLTSNLCTCPSPKYTWSTHTNSCKLTYVQGTCSAQTDCNTSENLICVLNTNNCTCPSLTTYGTCDCVKRLRNETYWDLDSKRCLPSISFNTSECSEDYMCKTITELTYCNKVSYLCECPQPGGWLSSGKCKKCSDDEIFFDGLCYYYSSKDNFKVKRDDVYSAYQNRTIKAKPAILNTNATLNFINDNDDTGEIYWISGKKKNNGQGQGSGGYSWSPTDGSLTIDSTICTISGNEQCINFNNGCYNANEPCNNQHYYICQS